jgi:two-component system, OmpR family, response regulator PhoP
MAWRILIVDDYADIREMYATFLGENGFEVVEAADGLQAIALSAASPIDLAIVDLGLPQLSGIEVIRRFRAEEALARMRIISITALLGERTRIDALEAGADLALAKPCLPEELLAAVRKLLESVPPNAPPIPASA